MSHLCVVEMCMQYTHIIYIERERGSDHPKLVVLNPKASHGYKATSPGRGIELQVSLCEGATRQKEPATAEKSALAWFPLSV